MKTAAAVAVAVADVVDEALVLEEEQSYRMLALNEAFPIKL